MRMWVARIQLRRYTRLQPLDHIAPTPWRLLGLANRQVAIQLAGLNPVVDRAPSDPKPPRKLQLRTKRSVVIS